MLTAILGVCNMVDRKQCNRILHMLYRVSVFAPVVVEVNTQSHVSDSVTTLKVINPAAGSVCSQYFFF